jgi:hypothetical protein
MSRAAGSKLTKHAPKNLVAVAVVSVADEDSLEGDLGAGDSLQVQSSKSELISVPKKTAQVEQQGVERENSA